MPKIFTSDQLGQLLASRRKALGLSQSEAAARLGISQNRLSELERQPAQLTLDRLLALAGMLGLDLDIQAKPSNPGKEEEGEW